MTKLTSPDRFHLPAADGIRALACLIVLYVHNSTMCFPETDRYLIGCGKIGVWLFFVLSAFLLTKQLIHRGFGPRDLGDYGVSRILRIYPPYALAILAYFYVGTAGIDTWPQVKCGLMLQSGAAHLWTIPVEFKFYLVLPLLAFISVKVYEKGGKTSLFAWSIFFVVVHQMFFPYFRMQDNSILSRWYLSCFQCGICAAVFEIPVTSRVSNSIVLAVSLAIVLSTPISRRLILGIGPSPYLLDKQLWFGALWAIFILVIVNLEKATMVSRFFASKILRSIGRWSFSVYLGHWYFAVEASQRYPRSVIAMLGSILLAMAFGALMFTVVERPLFRLRSRILTAGR